MHVSVTILQRKSGSCPTIKHKKKNSYVKPKLPGDHMTIDVEVEKQMPQLFFCLCHDTHPSSHTMPLWGKSHTHFFRILEKWIIVSFLNSESSRHPQMWASVVHTCVTNMETGKT